jgi:hypothetical protein
MAAAQACGLALGCAALGGSAAQAADSVTPDRIVDDLRQCREVADDAARLRCYDDAIAHQAKPAADAAAPASRSAASATAAASPSPPPLPPLKPRAPLEVRVDAGYSFAFGDYAGSSKVSGGTLEANSATGGLGGGLLAEAWLDNWPGTNQSVGLEYLQINNRAEVTATLPKGVSILTDPVFAQLDGAIQAHLVFFNYAYRPPGLGRFRPVMGAGLGFGYATATVGAFFSNDFTGVVRPQSASSSPIAGVQGFIGVEASLSDRLYVSLIPRVVVVSGHPIGVNQRYLDFILGANLGYRFR